MNLQLERAEPRISNMVGHARGPESENRADTNPGDWFAVSRKAINHPVVGAHLPAPNPADPSRPAWTPYAVWQFFLGKAAHCQRIVTAGGVDCAVDRGQFVASRNYLAGIFNWTPKTVRVFLAKLEKEGMLAKSEGPGFTKNGASVKGQGPNVWTVSNYGRYQNAPQSEGPRVWAGLPQKMGPQVNNKTNNYSPPAPSDREEVDRQHREAMLRGEATKGGKTANSAHAEQFTRGELDGRQGVELTSSGKVILSGEAEATLRQEYPGVDLAAVCDRAGPDIAGKGRPTHIFAMSVLRKWARIEAKADRGHGMRGKAPVNQRSAIDSMARRSTVSTAGASA